MRAHPFAVPETEAGARPRHPTLRARCDIVWKDLPRRTARRGAYSLAASALQGALFGSVLFASAHLAAREPPPLPVVEVQIVRSAPAAPTRPGADARGDPIALWVILPIRFEGL